MSEHRPQGLDVFDCNNLAWTPAVREIYAQSGTSAEAMMEKFPMWNRTYEDAAELVARMDADGVNEILLAAIHCGSWAVPPGLVPDMVRAYPNRIHGLFGVDPRDISTGVRDLETAVVRDGCIGAHALPHWFGLAPDDRAMYPFYAKCVELGVPIQIQAALAFQPFLRNTNPPSTFDNVAVDFPGLRLICIHTGFPWERELVALAWKHPNLYIGADNFQARRWGRDLVEFIRDDGSDKVMFGTTHPALEYRASIDDVLSLELPAEAQANLLGGTVRRVYGLPDAP